MLTSKCHANVQCLVLPQIEVLRVLAGSLRLNMLIYPDPRLFAAPRPYYWPPEMRSASDLTGGRREVGVALTVDRTECMLEALAGWPLQAMCAGLVRSPAPGRCYLHALCSRVKPAHACPAAFQPQATSPWMRVA